MDLRTGALERLKSFVAGIGDRKRRSKDGAFEKALEKEKEPENGATDRDAETEPQAERIAALLKDLKQDEEEGKKRRQSDDGKGLKVDLFV